MTPGESQAIKSITSKLTPRRASNWAEVEFRDLLNRVHIPRASALLDRVHQAANDALDDGDYQGAERMCTVFFKVCGLFKPPKDDAQIEALAKSLLDGMIAEAKARKGTP